MENNQNNTFSIVSKCRNLIAKGSISDRCICHISENNKKEILKYSSKQTAVNSCNSDGFSISIGTSVYLRNNYPEILDNDGWLKFEDIVHLFEIMETNTVKIETLNKKILNQKTNTDLFGEIIHLDKDLTGEEFQNILKIYKKKMHRQRFKKIGVIDKINEPSIEDNVITVTDTLGNISKLITEKTDLPAHPRYRNLIHLRPEYIIFKDLIDKDILKEIFTAVSIGYSVISFTTKAPEKLKELTQSALNELTEEGRYK